MPKTKCPLHPIYTTPVAGVTFEERQALLEALWASQESNDTIQAALVGDPKNPYDPNAIQVWAWPTSDGPEFSSHVGFIPKELAAELAPHLDRKDLRILVEQAIVARNHKRYSMRLVIQVLENLNFMQ